MADLTSPLFKIVYDYIYEDGRLEEVTANWLCNSHDVAVAKKSFEDTFNHYRTKVIVKSITPNYHDI